MVEYLINLHRENGADRFASIHLIALNWNRILKRNKKGEKKEKVQSQLKSFEFKCFKVDLY